MAFFEDLTKKTKDLAYVAADKAKDVAAVAADKAKDAAELTRITMAIAGEQREIDKNYRTIGEWFVSEYEGEIPDAVRDLVEAVNTSKAKIAELEASKPRKDDGTVAEADTPPRRSAPSAARPLTASSAPSAAPLWATESPPSKTSPPPLKSRRASSLSEGQAHIVPHHAAVGGLGDALVHKAEFFVVVDQLVLAGEDAALPPLGPGVGDDPPSTCPAQPGGGRPAGC